MNKLAQERGVLNTLRDKANVTGRILESINPEFASMMEKLRSTDERIRNHAADIRATVKSAKSLANRRDYLSAATNISAFHERCRWISANLKKFISSVDMKHYKFLLDQFDDEQKEQLFGYDPNKELEVNEEDAGDVSLSDDRIVTALAKQAGLSDWWFNSTSPIADVAHNLTNERGIAMRQMEKKFSISFLKELKASTHIMVARTEKFLQFLLGIFKRLATALAKRNVDQYVEAAKTFISKFAAYHDKLFVYYTKSIMPLKEQHEKLLAEKEEVKARQAEQAAAKQREQAARQTKPLPFPSAPAKPTPQEGSLLPFDKTQDKPMYEPGNLREMLSKEPEDADTKVMVNKENMPLDLKRRKAEFIASIEKLAENDDPKELMISILAHSKELRDIDPETSLKLLAIAEGIVEDYKTAAPKKFFDWSKPAKTVPKIDAPKKKDESDLLGNPPPARNAPLKHNIPEGRVDQKYGSIPVLAAISADRIRATPQASNHIASIFVKRLYDLNMDVGGLDMSLEGSVVNEIRKAVVRGIVLNNSPSDDTHNPLDRQLEIYTYVNLKDINPSLNGIAKLKVLCRLSLSNGSLSLRTISRNFSAE